MEILKIEHLSKAFGAHVVLRDIDFTVNKGDVISIIGASGSQFFIMHADAKHLDMQYAGFGKVLSGMDVVDAIAKVKTGRNDRPMEEQKIASITVDTHGEVYPEPTKLPDPYGRF